jgi:hypothetical protein
MRTAGYCLLAAWAVSTAAAEAPIAIDDAEKQFITNSANLLGDCSGFYEFMSDVYKHDNKPATGLQMHEMANGAMMAAAYLLYLEHNATGQKPKMLKEFLHYPQGRADTNKTRLLALLEQEDMASITAEQKRCLATASMQKEIVQQMRNESVGRQ